MRFRSTKHLYWYIGTAIFIVALHMIGILSPVERGVRTLTNQPVHWLYARLQGVRVAAQTWRSQVDARVQLPDLEHERDILKTRIALVEAENSSLRKELSYPDRKKWITTGADVIAKTTDITEQAIIINRGSADGINVDQVVFAEQGILIGTVSRVEEHRAVVRLLNDRQSRTGALHAQTAQPIGIVEGGYGLGVRLTLIPPDEVVQPGDLIVTNNSIEKMPRGLLIGRVVSVGRETYEPFQHALIEPILPYEEVRSVSVILN